MSSLRSAVRSSMVLFTDGDGLDFSQFVRKPWSALGSKQRVEQAEILPVVFLFLSLGGVLEGRKTQKRIHRYRDCQ